MRNHITLMVEAVATVRATYPNMTDEQNDFIQIASEHAMTSIATTGLNNAIENAREDGTDESKVRDLFTLNNLTPDSAYEIVRDVARMVMHTWNIPPKYEAGQFGHDFVMTRNEEGCGYWDGGYPNDGEYLTMIAKRFLPWHCTADKGGIHVYAM
ncbi:hypothetical protein AB0G15_05855 [Streptosporangium sp. NPDC023825]|uniref:hypothetical protein n=1 Tax=Streptosporangium sp. NPDC023825 TaxID=3154909 RepID=UPI0034386185